MIHFADPTALAEAAFRAYLAGESHSLREMTHPDGARWYHGEALRCLAGWLRLDQISDAVEAGTLTPEAVSAFRFDENEPVADRPLYHLRGVRVFGDIAFLEPADFLGRAFAGGAEVFGRPSRPEDPWKRIERFDLRGTVTRESDLARVPYVHTQKEPDAPESSFDEELVARLFNDSWLLLFDRNLFTPLSIFLRK